VLTEAAAILSFIADQVPERPLLPTAGTAARALAHEWLNFLSSTVHIAFRPVFRPERMVEDEGCIDGLRRVGIKAVTEALTQAEAKVGKGPYALGDTFSLCDGYLLVFYLWSKRNPFNSNNMPDFPALRSNAMKVLARPAVQRAMTAEGLQVPSLQYNCSKIQ
jgi:glutathione S-transferase